MDDFIEDYLEPLEIDWEYEFDAARFFDFTCPESREEAEEADRWFAISGNYPASSLVIKLRWGGRTQGEDTIASSILYESQSNSTDVDIGSPSKDERRGIDGDITPKTSVPWSSKPRSSTLMKPTASHLAKVNKARDFHSSHLCGRFQKSPIHVDERSLLKSPGFDILATKRQKLEIGYLRKVSHLKHQALLLHKKSQKDGTVIAKTVHSKMKVTVPKEPELETLQRALSRRSRTNSESSKHTELDVQTFRSRSLNQKIFKAPTAIPPKKSKPQAPVFQVFNLKNTERVLQQSDTDVLNSHNCDIISQSNPADLKRSFLAHPKQVKKICKTLNSGDAVKQEKHETPLQKKAGSISNKIFPIKEDTGGIKSVRVEVTTEMEFELQKDQRFSQNPPTELFDKLSLRSELGSDAITQPNTRVSSKGLKENAPDCFQPEVWKCVRKLNQCGSRRAIPGLVYESNMNRGFRIR